MNTQFSSFSIESLESDIEDYGQECYDEGYEDGVQHGWDENWTEFSDRESGLIKRTHNYNGQIVHVWIRDENHG